MKHKDKVHPCSSSGKVPVPCARRPGRVQFRPVVSSLLSLSPQLPVSPLLSVSNKDLKKHPKKQSKCEDKGDLGQHLPSSGVRYKTSTFKTITHCK